MLKINVFKWSKEYETDILYLKSKLAPSPILIVSDFTKSFVKFVDCSDIAIGACLAQANECTYLYGYNVNHIEY